MNDDASSPDWADEAVDQPMEVTLEPVRIVLRVKGESFCVDREGETFFIRHPRWSLMGSGDSLFAAQQDLLAEAAELASVMREIPLATMDLEASQLFRYVLRIS